MVRSDTSTALIQIVSAALAEPLAGDWPLEAPLQEAGLDSVAVLTIVDEIEQRLGVKLRESDLSAETFRSLSSLIALIDGYLGGR